MNIKEDILRIKDGVPRYAIEEMAAKELNAVMDLIMSDNPEEAAKKYFELGGNRRGITRTINTFLKKNPDVDDKKLKAFQSAANKVAEDSGIKTEYKKKTSAKTRDGEEMSAGGQSGGARKKTAIKRIEKEGLESKKELDILNSADKKKMIKRINKEHEQLERQLADVDGDNEIKLKELAKDILSDISEPPLTGPEKRDVKILQKFISDGENKQLAIDLMRDVIEGGLENLDSIYQHIGKGSITPDEKTAKKKEEQYKKIEAERKRKE
jgi:hypothetical protein